MGKVAISSSKIEASGKIGGRQSQGSIDDEGVIELGIDFKVGGLGITTDYGGAIKVSIAGQSITWGREGGTIELNVGGFEVIVEARDCIVTETKKIAGITVASHTYPDPGCKLPEPVEEPETPKETINDINEKGIEIPDSLEQVYVVCTGIAITTYSVNDQNFIANSQNISKWAIDIGSIPDILSAPASSLPFSYKSTQDTTGNGTCYRKSTQVLESISLKEISIWGQRTRVGATCGGFFVASWSFGDLISSTRELKFNSEVVAQFPPTCASIPTGDIPGRILFGAASTVKSYLACFNALPHNNGSISRKKLIVQEVLTLGKRKPPRPFLPTGNKPPMNQDCCEEILDKLDDFEEIFHIDFFKKNKFPVPAYLLAPGCDPQAKTEIKNYYGLFRALFQAFAHGTIISPKVAIQDTDSVKEGDQSLNSEYLSATGWAEAVTKMLYEVVDDGNVATNMDIRTGVTVTQLLVAVADLSHKVDTIIDVIGVTTIRKKDIVETSFSLVTQENNKGFDPKKDNQKIDLNDDRTTEQVLGDLLRTRRNPIVKEEIHPKSKTIVELLEALKNK